MKILLAWRDCQIGGVQTWMVGMARGLRRLGHDAELFFFRRGPFADHVPPDIGVHYGNLADCLRVVRSGCFDVVHAAVDDWDVGLSAVRWVGARLVVTVHGRVHAGWSSGNCEAIVGCSQWCADAQAAVGDTTVAAIPNGIDLELYAPPVGSFDGPPIVAWVGRGADREQKQLHRLAAIAPRLASEGIRLWIADPEGPTRVPPEVVAALQPIAERWGPVPISSMAEFYRMVAASGGCLLSTSAFEGLSMAYLEAQASGCPVLGPDVAGVREGVSPLDVGLYPSNLVTDALADFVLAAIRDPAAMYRRQKSCREFVANRFNLDTTVRRYLEIYENAAPTPTRIRRCLRAISRLPQFSVRRFVQTNWAAANHQYLASQQLAEMGEHELASAAIRSSFSTCPTLYLRTRRLFPLLGFRFRPDPLLAESQSLCQR